jgi:hypothetical protein
MRVQGPGTRDQWIQAILLVKSFKLVPRPLDKQGSKTKKWQIEAKPTWHLFWRENQLVRTQKKNNAKRRAPDLENQEWGYELNSRSQFASNHFKLVPRKLDPGPSFKVGLSLPCPLFPERCQAISGYENLNISYHCLIKFHDFGDKTQEGMKHQMRGTKISIFHTIVWSNFMTLGTKTQEGMKHQIRGTKISIFHTIVWSNFMTLGDKTQEGMKHQMRGDFTHNSIVLRKTACIQQSSPTTNSTV